MSVLHSLFITGVSAVGYLEGILYALQGEIPSKGFPKVVKLEPLLFASNTPFIGTARLEFASHLTGLESALPQDYESNAHQVATEEDEGHWRVQSRGLALVPHNTTAAVLEGGP